MDKNVTTKETLRRLVDELPTDELPAARRFLEYLRDRGDPVAHAFRTAPVVDEPFTPKEERSVQEAEREVAEGRSVPFEEWAPRPPA